MKHYRTHCMLACLPTHKLKAIDWTKYKIAVYWNFSAQIKGAWYMWHKEGSLVSLVTDKQKLWFREKNIQRGWTGEAKEQYYWKNKQTTTAGKKKENTTKNNKTNVEIRESLEGNEKWQVQGTVTKAIMQYSDQNVFSWFRFKYKIH